MRHLLILIFALVSVLAIAQDPQLTEIVNSTVKYSPTNSYFYYAGQSTDILAAGDSVWTYPVRIVSNKRLLPEITIRLDSTGGTVDTTTIVNLYSKTAASGAWILQKSITWTVGNDTIITMGPTAFILSEFWKTEVKSNSDSHEIKIADWFLKWAEE